jgi:hypothetical protein
VTWKRAIGVILTFALIDVTVIAFLDAPVFPMVFGSVIASIRVLASVDIDWRRLPNESSSRLRPNTSSRKPRMQRRRPSRVRKPTQRRHRRLMSRRPGHYSECPPSRERGWPVTCQVIAPAADT